jgi:hypothetical protein
VLARGEWKSLISSVRSPSAVRLNVLVGSLSHADRVIVLNNFTGWKESWCEEVHSKWRYWDELPHLILVMYPNDKHSQGVAIRAVQKWKELLDKNNPELIDRISFRIMSPDSGRPFSELVNSLAVTGHMDIRLEIELQEATLAPTCEQPGGEIHVQIFHANSSTGRNLDPAQRNARFRSQVQCV